MYKNVSLYLETSTIKTTTKINYDATIKSQRRKSIHLFCNSIQSPCYLIMISKTSSTNEMSSQRFFLWHSYSFAQLDWNIFLSCLLNTICIRVFRRDSVGGNDFSEVFKTRQTDKNIYQSVQSATVIKILVIPSGVFEFCMPSRFLHNISFIVKAVVSQDSHSGS